MKIIEMQEKAAALLTAARTESGARRADMLEEARLWISLAQTGPAAPPESVPDGTVMRIRTRGGALTVVIESKEPHGVVYPWTCHGCGDGLKAGGSHLDRAREEATRHARRCWTLPQPTDAASAATSVGAHTVG